MTDPNLPQSVAPQPPAYQPPAPAHQVPQSPTYPATPAPAYQVQPAPIVRKQGAWGLWWLVMITFGIYYFVWYARINRELGALLGKDVPADGRWWSQLIPIYSLIGLARTAKRLNAAHSAVGSPTRVGVFTSWFWAPGWFASQTRYLQRRINILHDILASHSLR